MSTAQYYVPNAPTTAQILTAIASCVSGGGGQVIFPSGHIVLTQALPLHSSVEMIGAGYGINYQSIPDDIPLPDFTLGTWLEGDGTFNAFEFDATDGTSAYSTQAAFSNAAMTFGSVHGFGLYNFRKGLKVGSNFNPGAFYSSFYEMVAIECGWGFWFENMLHVGYDKLYAFSCREGQFMFRSSSTSPILQPANCSVGEIISTTAVGAIKERGIVIECANGTVGGLSNAGILQSNRFAGGSFTQSVTTTNGSTSIAVASTAAFALNMPVSFTTTANGFAAKQIYFVASITTGHITLTDAPYTVAPRAATGSGSMTIGSLGMPNLEVTVADSNSGNNPCLPFVAQLDLEAGGETKMYATQMSVPFYWNCQSMQSGVSTQDITMRNCNVIGTISAGNELNYDFSDGNVNNVFLNGSGVPGPNSRLNGPLAGFFGGQQNRQFNLAQNTGNPFGTGGSSFQNTQPGGGTDLTYCGVPLCQATNALGNSTFTLNSGSAGNVSYTGSGATAAWALPSSISQAMNGMPFNVANCSGTSGAVLTLNASGGLSFNFQSAKTSYSIGQGCSIAVVAVWNYGFPFWQVVANNGAV